MSSSGIGLCFGFGVLSAVQSASRDGWESGLLAAVSLLMFAMVFDFLKAGQGR